MGRAQILSTKNVDLASYISAKTGQDCQLVFSGKMASFEFPDNLETRDCLVSYQVGGEVEAKKLLEIRSRLFRRLKGGA